MLPPNDLAALLAKRVLFKRLAVLAVILSLIMLRLWGCQKEKSDPSNISTAATLIADDDYSRYNNRIFICVKVVDGDTIDIGIPDPKSQKPKAFTRIRLWGIDTPEIAHPGFNKPTMYYGYQAAEFARKLMAGKKVRLELIEGYTREKFGRLLAYVYLPDGRMYNELALIEGFAYADPRFKHPRRQNFIQMESDARKNLRGLWPGITPDQLPHWYKPSKLNDFWDSRAPNNQPRVSKANKKTQNLRSLGLEVTQNLHSGVIARSDRRERRSNLAFETDLYSTARLLRCARNDVQMRFWETSISQQIRGNCSP